MSDVQQRHLAVVWGDHFLAGGTNVDHGQLILRELESGDVEMIAGRESDSLPATRGWTAQVMTSSQSEYILLSRPMGAHSVAALLADLMHSQLGAVVCAGNEFQLHFVRVIEGPIPPQMTYGDLRFLDEVLAPETFQEIEGAWRANLDDRGHTGPDGFAAALNLIALQLSADEGLDREDFSPGEPIADFFF